MINGTFSNKIQLYRSVKEHISENTIIAGSYVLELLGFIDQSHPYDLDVLLYDPSPSVLATLEVLYKQSPDDMKFDISKFNVQQMINFFPIIFNDVDGVKYKVDFFCCGRADNKLPLKYQFEDGTQATIDNPINVIKCKKRIGRPKDFAMLAEICNRIYNPEPIQVPQS